MNEVVYTFMPAPTEDVRGKAEPTNWERLLQDWFQVPGYPGVYILGCLARYVTLCSQQVRALNLVAALHGTGRLCKGTKVAIIGGGAGGMTAAAAAAILGAEVHLLEKLEDLMELQHNNRQRWIHPHIYDWPDSQFSGDSAHLPLLDWTAGYAENVAQQIERRFEAIKRTRSLYLKKQAKDIFLSPGPNATILHRGGHAPEHFPVIIVAVGFGLEPKTEIGDSYWAEDDFDGNFRQSAREEKWLVSGHGDGAFTDVMRLCIKRFRHAEIKDLFASEPGYLGVIDNLREIHRDPSKTNEKLSAEFSGLAAHTLQRKLQKRLRHNGPEVYLTGITDSPFGWGASILNRLIVLLLVRLERVHTVPGPYHEYLKEGNIYKVRLGKDDFTQWQYFNRVVLRHGPPIPRALEQAFPPVWEKCKDLLKRWQSLQHHEDETWRHLWPDGLFPPEPEPAAISDEAAIAFEKSLQELGVRAAALTVYKEIRSDGSSSIKYEVDRLSMDRGKLAGVRITYESATGVVGGPELDAQAQRNGFTWEDDYEAPPDMDSPIERLFDRARKLAIVVKFPHCLTPHNPPISFAVTFTLLNGDALSSYEYEQMYAPENRVHVNEEPLGAEIEYFWRIVWFPVEHLRIRLTLPESSGNRPFPSQFKSERTIPVSEIITQEGGKNILHFSPRSESDWHPRRSKWSELERQSLEKAGRLSSISPQVWDLTIHKALVGSCYSVDWRVRESTSDSVSLELDARTGATRQKLLRYAECRRHSESDDRITQARAVFAGLYAALQEEYAGSASGERFGISLRTYDAVQRRLVLVDSLVNGENPERADWEFRLPFGLGLSGACLKDGDKPYVYIRPLPEEEQSAGPGCYVEMERKEAQVLLAIPLKAPRLPLNIPSRYEGSRRCAAVLDMGSNVKNARLKELLEYRDQQGDLLKLSDFVELCQRVFQKFCEALPETFDNPVIH